MAHTDGIRQAIQQSLSHGGSDRLSQLGDLYRRWVAPAAEYERVVDFFEILSRQAPECLVPMLELHHSTFRTEYEDADARARDAIDGLTRANDIAIPSPAPDPRASWCFTWREREDPVWTEDALRELADGYGGMMSYGSVGSSSDLEGLAPPIHRELVVQRREKLNP